MISTVIVVPFVSDEYAVAPGTSQFAGTLLTPTNPVELETGTPVARYTPLAFDETAGSDKPPYGVTTTPIPGKVPPRLLEIVPVMAPTPELEHVSAKFATTALAPPLNA